MSVAPVQLSPPTEIKIPREELAPEQQYYFELQTHRKLLEAALNQHLHMAQRQQSASMNQSQTNEEAQERENAKMLVILKSGEQRLITFTLPKKCCTVKELFEQVGVPFSSDSNIKCISNPGADIDYVATVDVPVEDSNGIMAAAVNNLKTQQQVVQSTIPQRPNTQQQLQNQMAAMQNHGKTPLFPGIKKHETPEPIKKEEKESQTNEEAQERESAKILVILKSGEQRLITFTLPKKCCTVKELFEQVGVSFSSDSNIKCISNPGADIDYVATVDVPVEDSNGIMVAAVNNLKTQQQVLQSTIPQRPNTQQQLQNQMTAMQNHGKTPLFPGIKKPETPEPIKKDDVPPKYVKGYVAVCNYCGVSSLDHAKCSRCKRVFKSDAKVVAL